MKKMRKKIEKIKRIKKQAVSQDSRTLLKLRREIDRLDRALLKTLQRRFDVIKRIGEEKAHQGLPAYQKKRSDEILRNLARKGGEMDLNPSLIRSVYELIFVEAVKCQKKIIKAHGLKRTI